MNKKVLCALLFLTFAVSAMQLSAQVTLVPTGPNATLPGDIVTVFKNVVPQWIAGMQTYANEIFWVLAALDLAWFGIDSGMKYWKNIPILMLSAEQGRKDHR